ncbi:MAG: hypothetical protein ACRDI1_06665 [Actinomycetota bacterium]
MRSPVIAPVTRGLIGFPLFFLTTQTDRFFAWTIEPPLTAAILGANYFASTAMAILASRKHAWAEGRVAVSVALAFAPITTAATFIHLDRFHLDSFFGWFWVIAYGIYPPMLLFYLVKQLKIPGEDPPRREPLAGWVKGIFAVHAVLLLPLGLVMFISPRTTFDLWPWALTDLTSRALSAWVIALGVLALHSLIENDISRTKVAFYSYPVFGVLHLIGIARFSQDMRWDLAGAWVYLGYLATTLVLGAYGFLAARR